MNRFSLDNQADRPTATATATIAWMRAAVHRPGGTSEVLMAGAGNVHAGKYVAGMDRFQVDSGMEIKPEFWAYLPDSPR